jgi:hypothetical protein
MLSPGGTPRCPGCVNDPDSTHSTAVSDTESNPASDDAPEPASDDTTRQLGL